MIEEQQQTRKSFKSLLLFNKSQNQETILTTQQRRRKKSLKISPPILQHSTSIFTLVSPTVNRYEEMYANYPSSSTSSSRRHSYSSNQKNIVVKDTTSFAAKSIEPSISKSTPLKKIKTYNVQKKLTKEEKEKVRKMQELEDLISGRRGSTLKLTLTPKGLK